MVPKLSAIKRVNYLKTIIFNFRFFDWKTAWHLPVLIGYGVKITSREKKPFILSDDFDLKGDRATIGCRRNFARSGVTRVDMCKKGSHIIFHNGAVIARGAKVVCHHGTFRMGKYSYLGENCLLVCHLSIEFSERVAIGWNTQCYDLNFHFVFRENERVIRNYARPVKIGKYVWCGNSVIIGPGAVIPDHSIIGQLSLVNKDFSHIKTKGNLFAGVPAVLKDAPPTFPFLWNSKVEKLLEAYFVENGDKDVFEIPEGWPADPWAPDFVPPPLHKCCGDSKECDE